MGTEKTLPKISSFAAPTPQDIAVLRAMSDEDRRAVVEDHIAQGTRDIAEGRSTMLESDDDIRDLFNELWPIE